MKISFNNICTVFSSQVKNIYTQEHVSLSFDDIKLLTNSQVIFEDNYIYIGTMSMLLKKLQSINSLNCIIINDTNINIKTFLHKNLNIIEFYHDIDIFEVYNELHEFFIKQTKLEEAKLCLLEAFVTGKGLTHLVNIASTLLQNPIIILDLSYKILACSTNIKVQDKLWLDNIKKGYCSYDFSIAVKNLKSVKLSLKTKGPYEVTCSESDTIKLVCKIKLDNKSIGNVILLKQSPSDSLKDKVLLALLSELVAKNMQRNYFYKPCKSIAYEEFLYDILKNNICDKALIQERMKISNINFSNSLFLCVFDISGYTSYKNPPNYLNNNFSSLFSYNNPIYYDGYVVIVNDNKNYQINMSFIKKVKSFLISNKIYLGISKEFNDISKCKKYYLQALRAIELIKIINPKNPIVQYEDVFLYDLVYSSKNCFELEDFSHPVLEILKAYDEKNNSELFTTLLIYLETNQSIKRTCEKLFIHRNTFRYRMNKILQLTNINFSNAEEIFKLYTSYKLATCSNKLMKKSL